MAGLAVHRCGSSGPGVLWIHGYTMDSTLWKPLWDLLPGFRHIGVDLPGHGASGVLPPGLTLPELADRLAGVAGDHGADRVVGLSFGTISALQLAVDHPEVTRALVVAAPGLNGGALDPAAGRRRRELTALARMGAGGDVLADLWMSSPPDIYTGTLRHPQVRARIRAVVSRHSWQELRGDGMRTLVSHPQLGDLHRIEARTLVVSGTEDMEAFLRNAATIHRSVPGCRRLDVPGAGHLPLLECPEAVAGPLAAHLAPGPDDRAPAPAPGPVPAPGPGPDPDGQAI
ncbi:3-oxoadipate enol-lactonase [Planobispora rosea]|uniref:3-oxoadipate enol-lactonase n=1 Tax=Planobispora rosea TaxID=35762 RepID=A0A8J3S719_PLARO|nr:alpha/beta hydrolase [Planobispora rosea]GGS93556.1 3-oxoadipate enol-lactonase [Planobispora rosea]GIH87280.1 3-oxoadipate enol-lactonase [Planobispora rosea]